MSRRESAIDLHNTQQPLRKLLRSGCFHNGQWPEVPEIKAKDKRKDRQFYQKYRALMVVGEGFESGLRVIPSGRLAAFAIPGPASLSARQWRGCGKSGAAVSAPGGAAPLSPTSSARRSHNPENGNTAFSLRQNEKRRTRRLFRFGCGGRT